jgi:hypothetical protein
MAIFRGNRRKLFCHENIFPAGVKEAIARGAIGFDAVKHLCCAGSSAGRRGST